MTPEREAKIRNMLKHRQPTLAVVMENVHDPHNIMAVARSCESVGVPKIHVIHDKGQLGFDVRMEGSRSSASANKWVEIVEYTSTKQCFDTLHQEGFQIFSTHLSAEAKSVYEVDMTKKMALVFGNEKYGISQEACAVSLYEAFRQREQAGFYKQSQYSVDQVEHIFATLTKGAK